MFDFSLGNPSTPAPSALDNAIKEILNGNTLKAHGYTSANGCIEIRSAISNSLNKRFGINSNPNEFYITCGAAAALCCSLAAISGEENAEIIAIAPFFPEYKVFVEGAGAKFKVVSADTKAFQINFNELENILTEKTAGIIINSPNNPSGVVYSKETLVELASLLSKKEKEFGHPIYIISDEPYRELVYGNIEVPFVPCLYKNTIVCYSYSKSLSLPGERIGYVYVPGDADESERLYAAVAGAGRRMGYVCAPSLLQLAVAQCVDEKPNLEDYTFNRNILLENLTSYGYECAAPDGAFYLFVKAPNGDGNAFSEKAKAKNVLIVSGESFGCKEYVRISYCVSTKTVQGALPIFKELMEC